MTTEQIIEKFQFDLTALHLECYNALEKLDNIEELAKSVNLRFKSKQALTRYLNASKHLINCLEADSDSISSLGMEMDAKNYREVLNQMPIANDRLNLMLEKVINNDK